MGWNLLCRMILYTFYSIKYPASILFVEFHFKKTYIFQNLHIFTFMKKEFTNILFPVLLSLIGSSELNMRRLDRETSMDWYLPYFISYICSFCSMPLFFLSALVFYLLFWDKFSLRTSTSLELSIFLSQPSKSWNYSHHAWLSPFLLKLKLMVLTHPY